MFIRFFLTSIGNPGPLYDTLHSAGHHLLDAIHGAISNPPFQKSLSIGSTYTLYRSPSYMNDSGPSVTQAYQDFLSTVPMNERASAHFIVLHDELELPLGQLKLRTCGSLKGHNGLKSIKSSLAGKEFTRLGIGIGRPEARTSNAVSAYVLRRMNTQEKAKIGESTAAALGIFDQLAARTLA